MRIEINEVLYDTATSTVDKKFTFGKPGDPDGYEGKYFIYTNGGELSKYNRENITPIERESVKDWMLSR